jgi:SAM-dependent methyltransferase
MMLKPIDVSRYLSPLPNPVYALEYAYYLLGEVGGKTILDLGCGSGQNLVALVSRGANVVGLDISPHLIAIAQQRLDSVGKKATLRVGTAYDTGMPDESVDVVFAIAVLHHLELEVVREEIRRILRKGGYFVFSEPIRFSRTLHRLRTFFPARDEVSSYEHPLTRAEVAVIQKGFRVIAERNFRLPFIPLLRAHRPNRGQRAWKADRWLNHHFPRLERFATAKVMSLQKAN